MSEWKKEKNQKKNTDKEKKIEWKIGNINKKKWGKIGKGNQNRWTAEKKCRGDTNYIK